MNKFWLYIKNHVFVSQEADRMLLYNTSNGSFIETQSKDSIKLIEQLHHKQNLGCILLEKNNISNELLSFIENSQEKDILGTSEYIDNALRPIQLMPVLNIQRDIEKLRKDRERSIGENIIGYLTDINLFVDEKTDLEILRNIASQINLAPISQISINLGQGIGLGQCVDASLTSLTKNIVEIFNKHRDKLHFLKNYKDFVVCDNTDIFLDIIVDFPIDKEVLQSCINKNCLEKSKYYFYVASLEDSETAEKIVSENNIENYLIKPVYNGANLDFFKENVFLNKEDILSEPVSQRQIFCNQALNFNYFGKLTILSNGDVYANTYAEKLGNILDCPIIDLVYTELDKNTAWRKIRDEKPCNECLYRFLCPPPSEYEYMIGKPNLCNVKQ